MKKKVFWIVTQPGFINVMSQEIDVMGTMFRRGTEGFKDALGKPLKTNCPHTFFETEEDAWRVANEWKAQLSLENSSWTSSD